MLKSIEERMEDQLLEKERKLFADYHVAVKQLLNQDEDQASDEDSKIWISNIKNKILLDSILETLSDGVKSYPNDQELGAAIRKWYNQTEGKFV